jgi:segregation and condensation protein A
MTFLVSNKQFKGPIDLLLYLVRRHEIEVTSLGLADLLREFLEYLEVLKEISIDGVGDFIEVASLLIEIKTREVLPRNELEQDQGEPEQLDPRQDLVHRLLLYKQFRDASLLLEERGLQWQRRHARLANDAPTQKVEIADQPIEEIELWDLVSAFGRILRENKPLPPDTVIVDETPIHIYMQQIHARLVAEGKIAFTDLFQDQMYKSSMIGIFLAVLELTRHHNVIAEQRDLHSEIVLVPAAGFQAVLDLSNIDDYNPHNKKFEAGDPGSLVE